MLSRIKNPSKSPFTKGDFQFPLWKGGKGDFWTNGTRENQFTTVKLTLTLPVPFSGLTNGRGHAEILNRVPKATLSSKLSHRGKLYSAFASCAEKILLIPPGKLGKDTTGAAVSR